eukprot:gene20895-21626_t
MAADHAAVEAAKDRTAAPRRLPPELSILAVLAVIALVFEALGWIIIGQSFLANTDRLTIIILQVSVIGIIAVGVTQVIITGGVDLSSGSVVGIAAMVAASLAQTSESGRAVYPALTDLPIIVPVLAGLAVGLVAGLTNGLVIAYTGIPPFIATLGMMVTARGFAKWYTRGQPVSLLSDSYATIGAGVWPVVVFLVVAAIFYNFCMTATLTPPSGLAAPVLEQAIYPSLAGKQVLITGGATGIGAAMVAAFAQQGAQVTFFDIADDDGHALAATLQDKARAPIFQHCDLTDLNALSSSLSLIEQRSGTIDILINNAANDDRHNVAEVSAAYWDQRMAVNLRHQFFCAQAVAAGMQAKGRGVILNLGSISWHLALPNLTLYMTAKAAIEGLTRGLARDLGPHGIRVNTIIPGA